MDIQWIQVSKALEQYLENVCKYVSYVFSYDAFFLHLSNIFLAGKKYCLEASLSKVFNRPYRLLPTKVTAYDLNIMQTRLWQRFSHSLSFLALCALLLFKTTCAIQVIFVKLCLHSSYTMQNSSHFDEILLHRNSNFYF